MRGSHGKDLAYAQGLQIPRRHANDILGDFSVLTSSLKLALNPHTEDYSNPPSMLAIDHSSTRIITRAECIRVDY